MKEGEFHIRDSGGQEITSIFWNETKKKCGFPVIFSFLCKLKKNINLF